jgi:hypothetical protein
VGVERFDSACAKRRGVVVRVPTPLLTLRVLFWVETPSLTLRVLFCVGGLDGEADGGVADVGLGEGAEFGEGGGGGEGAFGEDVGGFTGDHENKQIFSLGETNEMVPAHMRGGGRVRHNHAVIGEGGGARFGEGGIIFESPLNAFFGNLIKE